jgi:hypothetical protein
MKEKYRKRWERKKNHRPSSSPKFATATSTVSYSSTGTARKQNKKKTESKRKEAQKRKESRKTEDR